MSELKQPKRMSLVEQVSLQLEQLIVNESWPVGTKIPAEPELASQLSVSRNTVREAVRALVHLGLLSVRQGDGTYVSSTSGLGPVLKRRLCYASVTDTFEVRQALEQEAARLAALRRTTEDIETMRQSLEYCRTALREKNKMSFVQADLAFHIAVAAASHNRVLWDLYQHMTEALVQSIEDTVDLEKIVQSDASIHTELFDAICRQDASAAAEAVRSYIEAAAGTH